MDVRAQIATVFHLDKCLGCHTCSVACKNIWTDRNGAEYMWWNNVETKPGAGYPILWEDQEKYKGGWGKPNGGLRLKSQAKASALFNIFHNPNLPTLDDYTRQYQLNRERLARLPAAAVILHPGPYNRGVELTDDVLEDPRSRYVAQVHNGVFVRMAVLELLLKNATVAA